MRATAFGLLALLMVCLAARGEVFFTFATTYEGEGQLFLLDADLLEVTPVGPAYEQPQYLGFLTTGADGQLYGATAEGLVRIDPKTGAWTYVGDFGFPPNWRPRALAFDSAGNLWMVAGYGSQKLYSVEKATAATREVNVLEREVSALAHWQGRLYAFTWTPVDFTSRLETLDPATGALSPIFAFDVDGSVGDATFDSLGNLRFLSIGGNWPGTHCIAAHVITDLASGPPVDTASYYFPYEDPRAWIWFNITGVPDPPAVEVPLTTPSLWAFALLLVTAGCALLCRV